MDQLLIYAALFFLEYSKIEGIDVEEVKVELRIYQSEEIAVYTPSPEEIMNWMDAIVMHSSWLDDY